MDFFGIRHILSLLQPLLSTLAFPDSIHVPTLRLSTTLPAGYFPED
jgi:hypothetical protein